MPNTYSKLYIHHVSAVKYRKALILPEFENDLYRYMAGIIKELGQFPIKINGMPDHIHIVAKLKPAMAPSKLVGQLKANASRWINEQGFLPDRFEWQTGGGTFSIGERHLDILIDYVAKQKKQHRKTTFQEEYIALLHANGIESEPEYMPDFFEDIY